MTVSGLVGEAERRRLCEGKDSPETFGRGFGFPLGLRAAGLPLGTACGFDLVSSWAVCFRGDLRGETGLVDGKTERTFLAEPDSSLSSLCSRFLLLLNLEPLSAAMLGTGRLRSGSLTY